MANPLISTRVVPPILNRIDRLIAAINARMQPGGRPIDRGGILRLFIERTLPLLEREYGIEAAEDVPTTEPKIDAPSPSPATKRAPRKPSAR